MSGYDRLEKLPALILEVKDMDEWHQEAFARATDELEKVTARHTAQKARCVHSKQKYLSAEMERLCIIVDQHLEGSAHAKQEHERLTDEYHGLNHARSYYERN